MLVCACRRKRGRSTCVCVGVCEWHEYILVFKRDICCCRYVGGSSCVGGVDTIKKGKYRCISRNICGNGNKIKGESRNKGHVKRGNVKISEMSNTRS